jgi:hypothetical protein
MTTATRTTETENAIIEIKLTREVNDKINYCDGYNIKAGREVYEEYAVKLTSKRNGKTITTYGKPGSFAFFALQDEFSGKYPTGAYARVGDAYASKEIYDLAMSMIAELDAEVAKTAEQKILEAEETARQIAEDKALDVEAAEYAQQIKNGMCPKCGTWCYGSCEA